MIKKMAVGNLNGVSGGCIEEFPSGGYLVYDDKTGEMWTDDIFTDFNRVPVLSKEGAIKRDIELNGSDAGKGYWAYTERIKMPGGRYRRGGKKEYRSFQ